MADQEALWNPASVGALGATAAAAVAGDDRLTSRIGGRGVHATGPRLPLLIPRYDDKYPQRHGVSRA